MCALITVNWLLIWMCVCVCLDDSMMPRGFKWEIERGVCVLVLGVNLAYIWGDERECSSLFIQSVCQDRPKLYISDLERHKVVSFCFKAGMQFHFFIMQYTFLKFH